MRFMLMMNVPAGTGDYQINNWKPEEFKAHLDFMHDYNIDLRKAGEFVDAQGLSQPGEAKLVRASKNGGGPRRIRPRHTPTRSRTAVSCPSSSRHLRTRPDT